jgi:tetratricopeptide (TPR) repeat protein
MHCLLFLSTVLLAALGAAQDRQPSPTQEWNALPSGSKPDARQVAERSSILIKRSEEYKRTGRYVESEKLLRSVLISLEQAILSQPLTLKAPHPPNFLCKAPPDCVGLTCSAIGETLGALAIAASPALSVAGTLGPNGSYVPPSKISSDVMKMESVPQAALCKESSIFIAESDALVPLVLNETLIVLADVCAAQGKFGEAERYYRRALVYREETLGGTDEGTIALLENYAALLTKVGRTVEAEAMLARRKAIRASTCPAAKK